MSGRSTSAQAQQLPPQQRIEAALREATERFAAELALPTSVAPSWGEFDWTMARASAVMHGVTPLLAGVLRWREPPEWLAFAEQQRRHTALQQQRLAASLAAIDHASRRAGLALVALKGAALHALGLYRAGERPMADIDLLAAPHDLQSVRPVLESLGLQQTAATWKHAIFEPYPSGGTARRSRCFGERADAALKIELHTHIAERLPVVQMDISQRVWPSEPQPGLNPYPSTAALLLHLLLHAAGSMIGQGLRLIQLHDVALLAARMRAADWDELLEDGVPAHRPWWALPPLELIARYYPGRIPGAVLATLRPLCPRVLRRRARRQRLSAVSYDALRLRAFPAWPWALTLADKLGYIRSRIRPEPELAVQRAVWRRESWAADYPWVRQSQGRLILHWLLARPLRPVSMHAVRAALMDQAAHAARRRPAAEASGDDKQSRPRGFGGRRRSARQPQFQPDAQR